MNRICGILSLLVIWFMAIFTMQVASLSGEGSQAGREQKSEIDNVPKLFDDSDCRSCHASDRKVVGPAYRDVAKKYAGQTNAAEELARSIRQGGSGNWGNLAMPPHPDLKDAQLAEMVQWILSLNNAEPDRPQEAKAKQYTYTVNGKTLRLDFPLFVEGNNQWVTKDAFRGYQLYNSYCYRCHGQDATESELAPDLKRFTSAAAQQEFLSVVMVGREEKGMPSWAGFLSEEDVQQIYKYVKGRSLELIPVGRPRSEYDSEK
ncbi:MAG: cytochrome C [Acidobacteria bacterium]|nr:MAG: cytochrome C [Acidobacteriota bacterium]